MTTDFGSLLQELTKAYPTGFAIALHIRFTSPRFLLQTYDQRWIETYSRDGIVMHDPTVRWGLRQTGTIRWEDLPDTDEAGQSVLNAARDHGLSFGFTVAWCDHDSRSVASFVRPDRPATDAEMRLASDQVMRLHALTIDSQALGPADRAAVERLSIRLTLP